MRRTGQIDTWMDAVPLEINDPCRTSLNKQEVNEMEENMITIIDEDGNEQLHEILLTFELDDYDKQYVVFAPVGTDDEEDLIHVASYTPDESGEVGTLNDIEDDEEWAMVEEVINTFFDDEEE